MRYCKTHGYDCVWVRQGSHLLGMDCRVVSMVEDTGDLYRWVGEQPGGLWVDTDEMLKELIEDGVVVRVGEEPPENPACREEPT